MLPLLFIPRADIPPLFPAENLSELPEPPLNLSFSSIQAAIDYWNEDWGDAVRNAQTMDQFIQDLEGGARKYNDATKDYSDRLRKQYATVEKYRANCLCSR